MATYTNLGDFLTACANSIRAAEGSSGTIVGNDIPDRISALGGSVIPSDLPSDGKTRICYKIPSDAQTHGRSITLMFYQATSSTSTSVDWGDSSTATSSSGSGRKTLTHTYSSTGEHIVTITITAGTIYFGGGSTYTIYSSYAATSSTSYLRPYIQWIVLGTGVTKLDTYALANCNELKEIRFPSSGFVTIGNNAFRHCISLKKVVIPNTVTTLSTYTFYSCYSLKEITFPDNTSIKTIPDYMLYQCMAIEKLSFPSRITAINTYALYSIQCLKEITLPSTMTSIPTYMLYAPANLTTLSIPSTVTSIAANGLSGMYSLQKLRFNSATPPTVAASSAFTDLSGSCIISVPTGKLSAYTSAANYPSSSTYTYIEES